MLRRWGTIVLLLLATPVLALAQNTGKLAGRVLDASTGEPLPGANVVIVGTQLGTAADIEGNYFIIGVPVGTYDVQASFVGYTPLTQEDVEINNNATRELNFSLTPGTELDEIVVEYERPLIQKDAIGVPKVVTAEDIQNLPVRGVADVASLQAGVVKQEGSGNLYVRGGREQEVQFYVDGVKVVGSVGVPTQAIQEQEMLIGSIPAKYGDAMSGIISITTKSGAPNFFGSVETITSEVLDAYGFNQVSATLGGPLVGDKLQFFVSGQFEDIADPSPRAIGFPQLSDDDLAFLQQNPQAVRIVNNETGAIDYIPFPGDVAPGTSAEDVVARLNVPEGWSLTSEAPSPFLAANSYTSDMISREAARPEAGFRGLTFNGNLTFSPSQAIRIRAGGGYDSNDGVEFSAIRSLYAPGSNREEESDQWRVFGAWTHYLSNSTFYQLQVDYSDYQLFRFYPGFSTDIRDALFYGDIDHETNAVARRYMNYDPATGTYVNAYGDGSLPGFRDAQNTWGAPGVDPNGGFQQQRINRLGFRANATTQIGLHQIEFGGEYEQQTRRWFDLFGADALARYHNDGNVEGSIAVDRYEDLTFSVMDNNIFYYGYNYLGTEEVDDQDLNAFVAGENYNVAPYRPIYYAGYIQDKIEYRDLVLNLGVRVDVFDNNTLTLRDPFSLYPIVRAGDVGNAPAGIGSDYAVYYNTSNQVVGYRDLEGNFYNASGQSARALDIRNAGRPKVKTDDAGNEIRRLTEEVFTDYEPQVNFQPRIGVSFPVTDQALFFASYDVVTQRPTENNFDTIQQWQQATRQSKRNNNPGLEPERTTSYELGFRQRVGARAALTLSGFYKQIENKISLRIQQNVFPGNYQWYENVDFGTVKGAEFEFDLRRTNNISLNANYTISFAQGTGSDAATTSQIVWRQESDPFYPRFISPLDFDQRHKANLTLDYRLGENEGPRLFGGYPLSNFGFNIVGQIGSGLPYTRRADVDAIWSAFNGFLEGGINEENMPATSRVDLRVDRAFQLGGANLTAYLWVQNLFDQDNITNVYAMTGLPDVDGWLTSDEGVDYIAGIEQSRSAGEARSFVDHYSLSARSPFNYGLPRTTRLGLRLDF